MVLTDDLAGAIDRLDKAAKDSPSAQTWSDLAAARYAAASELGRAALYPQALAAADAALKLDPNLPEALFNRALIIERLGLIQEARTAWNRYLSADPSSKWADEARRHLAALPAVPTSSRWTHDLPLIENAAASGDVRTLHALLAEHAARADSYAEIEWLGRWGDAVLQKNETDANRWLTIARAIGSEIASGGNDTLLRDAVQAIDAVPPAQREVIASAHSLLRTGRIAATKRRLDDASRDLARAEELFLQARSPMTLMARFYLASVRQSQNAPGSRAELTAVVAEADRHPDYRALRAHARWELGRALGFDYDWVGAIEVFSKGAALFHDVGDRASEAFVETMLSYDSAAIGRGDESWSSLIVALGALSREGSEARIASALNAAMRAERLAGRNDAALALARLPEPAPGDPAQLILVLDAMQFESMLESTTGNEADGSRTARRASALAQGIADPALRARYLADFDVAMAAATVSSNPGAALAPLTRAIDFYRRSGLPQFLPEALLLRARCESRMRDGAGAARDLEEGMQIVDRHDIPKGSTGGGVVDAAHDLYVEALLLDLDRGDKAAAFAVAERSRGAVVTVSELQQRLAGSVTAVIEPVVCPRETVTFAVTENDLQVFRTPMDRGAWTPLVEASLSEKGTTAAAALYDDLIRPAEAVVARARALIIVPDPRLESVPFPALYDSTARRYLVERLTVATAPSAASLQRDAGRSNPTVVTMMLPAGEGTGAPALPEGGRELEDIHALYRRARAIPAENATLAALRDAVSAADVVHVTGHTEGQTTGGEHALMLAGPHGALDRASSRTIAATPIRNGGVVVLAACETLRPPASPETHALSLGAAFIVAGAAETIGTLTPIADRDARTIFRIVHQHLAAGESASAALRSAQLAAIRDESAGGSHTWRSVALMTTRISALKG
jgi:CHAT domain-containing protein